MLNIAAYHFVSIDRPAELAETLHERADAAGLCGTILVAGEGINLFLAGRDEAIHGFLDALREDARFADLLVKFSHSRGQPFGRPQQARVWTCIPAKAAGAEEVHGREPAEEDEGDGQDQRKPESSPAYFRVVDLVLVV